MKSDGHFPNPKFHFISFSLVMMMPSLHSSVGSKSTSGRPNLFPGNTGCYREEESTKALRSSWIRRLQPPNVQTPPKQTSPSPRLADHSACSTRSGHRTTISTDESCTPTSIPDFPSAFFVRRLLNFRREPQLPQEDLPGKSCLVAGFGPYQVRNGRRLHHADTGSARTSLALPNSMFRLPGTTVADSNRLGQKHLQFPEATETPGQQQQEQKFDMDRDGAEHGGIGNCNSRNSDVEASFPFTRRKTHLEEEEQERRETGFCRIGDYGGGSRQLNWLHHNGKKMVADERNAMDERSRSVRAEGMVSRFFPERRVTEDQQSFRLSSFFCFRPSLMQDRLKKQEYSSETRTSSFIRSTRDECLRCPMGRETNKKFMDSGLTSSRIPNHPWAMGEETRCSSLSRSPVIAQDLLNDTPEQTLYEQHLSVEPRQTTTTVHGVKCVSKSRGAVYYDNAEDNAACSTYRDPHFMQPNVVLHQLEKQAPAAPNEPEELPFRNMECHKRANATSSAFPIFTVSSSGSRKRIVDTNEYVPAKSRKLGAED